MGINKDQIEGRVKEGVGKAQEKLGKAVNSPKQEAKCQANLHEYPKKEIVRQAVLPHELWF